MYEVVHSSGLFPDEQFIILSIIVAKGNVSHIEDPARVFVIIIRNQTQRIKSEQGQRLGAVDAESHNFSQLFA